MIVNVCPAATSKAPPDRFWAILMDPARFGEWAGARTVAVRPPGASHPGQVVDMRVPYGFTRWRVQIEVAGVDEKAGWIDVVARLPFGIDNREHLTLTETPEGGTLVRLN